MATELDNARAEAAISALEDSLKRGQISAQQVKMLEEAQSNIPIGYDPAQSSPEAVNLVTLYHNITGEPHPTPEYMIRNFLTRKFPRENWIPQDMHDRPVYALTPNGKYREPTLRCWFHTTSERKTEIEALGIYATCEKGGGFNNEFEIETHMQSAHRRQYEAYQRAIDRKDQLELRELQRATLAAMRPAPVKETK